MKQQYLGHRVATNTAWLAALLCGVCGSRCCCAPSRASLTPCKQPGCCKGGMLTGKHVLWLLSWVGRAAMQGMERGVGRMGHGLGGESSTHHTGCAVAVAVRPFTIISAVPQRWLSHRAGCHLPASSAMPPAGVGTPPEELRGNTSRRDGMGKGTSSISFSHSAWQDLSQLSLSCPGCAAEETCRSALSHTDP